jgi:HlyD family secretion protein
MRFLLILIVVVGVVAGGAAYYAKQLTADAPTEYRTVTVEKGDVAATITATGTLEAEELIDVGAQVAGRIQKFGPDPNSPNGRVDYNSVVKEGDLLAEIDPRVYKAQFDEAQATLKRTNADLSELKAKCAQAEKELKRAESLRPQKAIADTDYDLDVANYEVAKANVDVGQAMIEQSQATLDMAKSNLEYTIIKSPVNGQIIDRRVNIGQTVVASLSAPSLFLIAKDLSKMQVWASVNEADIGHIKKDMPVEFTVDAFSNETFHGKVQQIRLNAQMTQNVVTYTVVVAVENKSGRLLPYLTTNLRFVVDTRHDVLLVPNGALRWKPKTAQIAPQFRGQTGTEAAAGEEKQARSEARATQTAKGKKPGKEQKEKDEKETGRLWVQDGASVRPVDVQIGVTNGAVTEVSGGDLREGMEAIIGESRLADASSSDTTNPFLPKIGRGGKR